MYKKVIFRDRQELQADDLNNIEQFTEDTISSIVSDAITGEKSYFSHMSVIQLSSTEIRVEPGKLYRADGKIFTLESAVEFNLFTYLPLNFRKIVAIVAYGTEIETQVEPRDFLIDVVQGTTEPRAVAMLKLNSVNLNIIPGSEAVHPAYPLIPPGVVPIAYITLTTTGISLIERAVDYELPSLNYLSKEIKKIDTWKREFEPKLTGLSTDVGAIYTELSKRPQMQHVIQLAIDMARIKERLEMPDNYVFYGADHFLTLDETDTSPSDYSALVQEGIRPAPAAQSSPTSLTVLNPLDPNIKIYETGLVIPTFEEYPRLAIQNYVGNVRINAYQYQTTQLIQKTVARTRIRYGPSLTVCTNSTFWRSGRYDPITGIFRRGDETWEVAPEHRHLTTQHAFIRLNQFWVDTFTENYWEAVTTTHTVQGSLIAQTFLAPNTGYLTSLDLYFVEVDASSALTLAICECSAGRPNPSATLATVNVPPERLKTGWCNIQLREPVLLDSGKMYAIILATAGAHRVGYSQGSEYTQGVLMYGQDAQFLFEDASRDLMMRLHFAKFKYPLTIVQLQPLQLSGGIHNIDLLFEGFRPEGTDIYFEYQLGGIWYRISNETAEQLRTAPNLLPLRAVLVGTLDLQPAFRTTNSRILLHRYGTTFKHYSTVRTLANPSNNIIVRLLLENFDQQNHTVNCQLKVGNNLINATSVTSDLVENQNFLLQSNALWKEYRFQLQSPITSYQIVITGNCGNNPFQVFHVAARYDLAL